MDSKFMHSIPLIVLDFISLTLLSIHLTDLDVALKIIASVSIISVNVIAFYKQRKK